jgi:transaldolase
LVANFNTAKDNIFKIKQIEDFIKDGWYGLNTEIEKLLNGYTVFQNPTLLAETLKNLNNSIPNELFSGIKKPKMKINDRFGMFSFDLASMAMTFIYEYFNNKGEKVDSNFVQKVGTDFVFTPTNELVKQEIKKQPNGNPVVVSSVRNSLIDFEKKEQEKKAVEIFILCSASSGVKAEDYIYNAMAGISVAQNLTEKNIQVKVTALFVSQDNEKRTFFHLIPVKNFNQPLDINAVAYVCGDARFYRFQGFKAKFIGWDSLSFKVPSNLGIPIKDIDFCSKTIEKDYIKNSKRKQGDSRLYFGNSRNIQEVKSEVVKAIKILELNYGNTN